MLFMICLCFSVSWSKQLCSPREPAGTSTYLGRVFLSRSLCPGGTCQQPFVI